jgi:hypothetical protein
VFIAFVFGKKKEETIWKDEIKGKIKEKLVVKFLYI